MKDLLATIADFLEDEADNRAAAGSEMSDYEREPRELAERVRQAISATPAPVAGGWREPIRLFCWLIEAPGARYLGARTLGVHEFYWTQDANDALRFYSEAQADAVMMAIRELSPDLFGFARTLGDARAAEHGWLPAPPSTDPVPVGGDEQPPRYDQRLKDHLHAD